MAFADPVLQMKLNAPGYRKPGQSLEDLEISNDYLRHSRQNWGPAIEGNPYDPGNYDDLLLWPVPFDEIERRNKAKEEKKQSQSHLTDNRFGPGEKTIIPPPSHQPTISPWNRPVGMKPAPLWPQNQ